MLKRRCVTPVSWGCLLASRGLFVNSVHRVTGLALGRTTCHCELWGQGSVLPARPPYPQGPGGEKRDEREGRRGRKMEWRWRGWSGKAREGKAGSLHSQILSHPCGLGSTSK